MRYLFLALATSLLILDRSVPALMAVFFCLVSVMYEPEPPTTPPSRDGSEDDS